MKNWMLLICLVASMAGAQVNVSVSPVAKQTFFNQIGTPCVGCSLYSYIGGTTTPTPTYVDSTGTAQNTNPIILDIAGAAGIWLNNTLKYKFALIDTTGTTVWTVDNVSAGGAGLPCTTLYAIQFANNAANALTCDPSILINPSAHSIQIGGPISGPYFSMHNNGTITSSWTFDVTSPMAALISLGTIPYTQLPASAADTVLGNATGSTATPTAIPLPTGCTSGVNYSSTTHTWSCAAAGTTPLSSLASQAADTVVMNATGSAASPTAVVMPTGCSTSVNYNTVTHAWTCAAASGISTRTTPSNTFGGTYTNSGATARFVTVAFSLNLGVGHTCGVQAFNSGTLVAEGGVQNSGGVGGVSFYVLPGASYNVNTSVGPGSTNPCVLDSWTEWN